MMNILRKAPVYVAALALTSLLGPAFARADDDEVAIDSLPAVVADGIRAALGDASLEEIEAITVAGNTLYVAEGEQSGRELTLHVSSSGVVLRRVEEISEVELPEAARTVVTGYGGSVDEVERVTEDGTTTYAVEIDGSRLGDVDIILTPDGAVVSERVDAD